MFNFHCSTCTCISYRPQCRFFSCTYLNLIQTSQPPYCNREVKFNCEQFVSQLHIFAQQCDFCIDLKSSIYVLVHACKYTHMHVHLSLCVIEKFYGLLFNEFYVYKYRIVLKLILFYKNSLRFDMLLNVLVWQF